MNEAGQVKYFNGDSKNSAQHTTTGVLEITPVGKTKLIRHGEKLEIMPDKLLWIDTKKQVAVLAALLLPKKSRDDFGTRLALGFTLGQTKRHRQYVLAPFDEAKNIGELTPIDAPARHIVFGREGLTTKTWHYHNETESVSHTPHHHNSLHDIMEHLGDFTSNKHFQITFESTRLWLRDLSAHGTLALGP